MECIIVGRVGDNTDLISAYTFSVRSFAIVFICISIILALICLVWNED